LLILDEPTNHLDVDSREALVHALTEYEGAVILISHDRHLIEATVDRLWLVADGTVRPYDGDLDDYRRSVLDQRGAGDGSGGGKAGISPARQRRRDSARRREEIAPLRKQVRDAEAAIERLHKEIGALDLKLGDGGLYERPDEAAGLARQRADAVKALARAEERWLAADAAWQEAAGDG
jgi:ATP-binding cassette subfamily F protein 3